LFPPLVPPDVIDQLRIYRLSMAKKIARFRNYETDMTPIGARPRFPARLRPEMESRLGLVTRGSCTRVRGLSSGGLEQRFERRRFIGEARGGDLPPLADDAFGGHELAKAIDRIGGDDPSFLEIKCDER
jgi:hypothetical protein